LAACGTTPGTPGNGSGSNEPIGGSRTVTGEVIDFQTGATVTGTPTVTTSGVLPEPMVEVQGASFTITEIPDNSQFQILASVPPNDAPTYSPATVVGTMDLQGVQAYTIAQTYLGSLASGFSVTPTASNGILLVHLLDGNNNPTAGVAGSNLVLAGASGASGPHFLDASLKPSTATSSSSSGWAVFFEVPPGAISLGQAANATVSLQMATSPVAAGTVTIANVYVTGGPPPPPPTNVSFAQNVVPIFTKRGCTQCHTGGGIGKNLGDLALDGGTNHVYSQLTNPQHPLIIQTAHPAQSLVLTMPSYESPPDAHPNVIFTGPQDPDYLTILAWITAGALNN
jgi:hypothetical protein